jgi:tetratricopeptide (TPR) repeat protein
VSQDKGEYAEAEPCFRRALEALEKVAFPDPYQLANAAKNLADMLDLQGKLEEAEQLVCSPHTPPSKHGYD